MRRRCLNPNRAFERVAALIAAWPIILAAACVSPSPSPTQCPLGELFEEYWAFQMRRHPERATYLGDHRYNDQLYDYSLRARQAQLEQYGSMLRGIRETRTASHGASHSLSAVLFERMLQEKIDLAVFPEHLMPIKQQGGPQITLGMLRTTHPFNTPKDCADYAARLRGFSKQVDDLIFLMNEGIRRNIRRPRITIEQTLPQIDALITEDPKASVLCTPTQTLSDAAGGEASRRLIEDAVASAVADLRRLRDYLSETYLPQCRRTVGYCHLPGGRAWYRRLVRYHTTTNLSPERIHSIGLKELVRIHAEMGRIAREVGFEGNLQAFIAHVRNDPAQHNSTAEEIMHRHAAILRRSNARLGTLFGRLPQTPCGLKEIEPFRAAAAPAAYYYNAPDDGSRPAYFYVNTHQPETRPIYTMEALAYHEAMPGHHLQHAIVQEKKDVPKFRRFGGISAFVEGWALYAEQLGHELGGYRDPYARFGQLTYDAWRAARLVVDTGIHHLGWTRDEAIAFMKENTALSEQNIVSEVDRYIAWPGQALSYKIGQLGILKLRRRAEEALGTRFDIRAFHDHLLAEGPLPLSVLRARMDAWIRSCQTSP